MPTVALIGPELFPIPPIRGGAAELFIDRLAHHLTGWRPVVIGPSDPDLPPREVQGQVEYRRVSLGPTGAWLYRRYRRLLPLYDRKVAAHLREIQPRLLHVHNRPLLARYLKSRFPRLPVILHLHNLSSILGKRERPAPGELIPVEAFLACSNFVAEREGEGLGRGAAVRAVIYNGVDEGVFRPRGEREEEAQAVRARYGLGEEPVVLFAGKIRESKGVGLLLRAMGRVWEIMPQTALVLVGGAEFGRGRTDRETAFVKGLREEVARAPGRVVMTGFIPPDRMPEAYLLGDIFVGPSQNEEGLGMVFLEASAAGLPIVATNMGGIPEVVREGLNGLLLTSKNDAAELAGKILTLLSDQELRRVLGRQGREWICREFTWEKIARDQEALYDMVLGGGRGDPALPSS